MHSIMKEIVTVNKNLVIDVAIVTQDFTKIDKMINDHIINLDEIPISKEVFQNIFYPHKGAFGVDKNVICNNDKIIPYISFLPQFRTYQHKNFYLLEQIIKNIETDLNVSRDCFTIESRVELTNQLTALNSLYDINYSKDVVTSLTWENILEMIKNYKILDKEDNEKYISPIFVISVVFKTPTCGVNNTVIRFNYKIINM